MLDELASVVTKTYQRMMTATRDTVSPEYMTAAGK